MKPIDELRNIIKSEAGRIPDFVNVAETHSKMISLNLKEIYVLISKLTNENILSTNSINVILNRVDDVIDEILDLVHYEPDIQITLSNLIIDCIERYKVIAIELELYEVAENLTAFEERYNP